MTKPGPKTLRDVRVSDVSREAEGILGFELVDLLQMRDTARRAG